MLKLKTYIIIFNLNQLIDPVFFKNTFNVSILFFIISFLIGCFLFLIPYFSNGRFLKTIEKSSEYECGFEPFDSAVRQPFTIHFYIVGILFLIFDVEIALLFPWSLLLNEISWEGYWLIIFFLAVLILGFLYEWKIDAITWNFL